MLPPSLGVEAVQVELEILEGHVHHSFVGEVYPRSAVLGVAELEDRLAVVVKLQGSEEGLDVRQSSLGSSFDDSATNFIAAMDGMKKPRSKGRAIVMLRSQCVQSTSMAVSTPQS